jgi:hypothetical protein
MDSFIPLFHTSPHFKYFHKSACKVMLVGMLVGEILPVCESGHPSLTVGATYSSFSISL